MGQVKVTRVLVTRKCNKRCRGCVTKKLNDIETVSFKDLMGYQSILITGGEPMLMSDRCVELVHRLRLQGFTGKIMLSFSDASKVGRYWAADMLIDEVDAIFFTLHYNSSKDKLKADLKNLRKLDKYLKEHDRRGKDDILYIDKRIFSEEYKQSLKGGWKLILPMEWVNDIQVDKCDYVFFDLEAEG